MKLRISQAMDGLMSTFNSQIQRAIHEAISTKVLPQIQNTIRQVQNVNASVKDVRTEKLEQRSGDMTNQRFQDNRGGCHYSSLRSCYKKFRNWNPIHTF